jgi:putative transcriptional regulator
MRKIRCRLASLVDEWNLNASESGKKEARLSQSKLADKTRIARTTIYRLYNNEFSRVDVNTMETLCEFFGCEVGDFLQCSNPHSAQRLGATRTGDRAKDLSSLANLGFTHQGAAIVDAVWFTPMLGMPIGIILTCNPSGVWQAYMGTPSKLNLAEDVDAKQIAEYGAEVPFAIAKAAFPDRDFAERA